MVFNLLLNKTGDRKLKLENAEIKNFDPSLISKGQEIFALKATNVLDKDDNNLENCQIDEVKYYKDTGISIERYEENKHLEIKKTIIN